MLVEFFFTYFQSGSESETDIEIISKNVDIKKGEAIQDEMLWCGDCDDENDNNNDDDDEDDHHHNHISR